jgi:hypothetical protein
MTMTKRYICSVTVTYVMLRLVAVKQSPFGQVCWARDVLTGLLCMAWGGVLGSNLTSSWGGVLHQHLGAGFRLFVAKFVCLSL